MVLKFTQRAQTSTKSQEDSREESDGGGGTWSDGPTGCRASGMGPACPAPAQDADRATEQKAPEQDLAAFRKRSVQNASSLI